MRELLLSGPGALEWREREDLLVESDLEAIVKPIYASTCDLDRALIAGSAPVELPVALGHECVAEVVEIGDRVRSVEVGERVVVPFQVFCGSCSACAAGRRLACESVPRPSIYGLNIGGKWGGMFSDLLRVPYADAMLTAVPATVDPRSLTSAGDNLTDAWRGIGPFLLESPGAEVLVVGGIGGSIGLFAVAIAVALEARKVEYIDTDASRVEIARSLGASSTRVDEYPHKLEHEYPIVFDASVTQPGISCAIRSTACEGDCTSGSIFFGDITVPFMNMFMNSITFHSGIPDVLAHIDKVIALVESGRLDPTPVYSEEVVWDDLPLALAEPSLKPIVIRK